MGVELYISPEDLGRTLVARVNTNSVKSEDQDERCVLECEGQLVLLNLNRVETSTNAQNPQVEWSFFCEGGVHERDP